MKEHSQFGEPIGQAVIYTRCASMTAGDRNAAVTAQEEDCRSFARNKNLAVCEVFSDIRASGSTSNRPGLQGMLRFLRERPQGNQCVVIVADAARLARDTLVYFEILDAIDAVGASLVCAPSSLSRATLSLGRSAP